MGKKFYFLFFLLHCMFFSYSQVTRLVLNDPDKNAPTNVRSKPGGDIINTIDSRLEMVEVNVLSKDGNYFLVDSYDLCGRGNVKLFKRGYIHYSVMGGFIQNFEKKQIPIYDNEFKTSSSGTVNCSDEFVNVLDKKNSMYFVFRKKTNQKFWIDSKYFCFSACTNCN